MSAVALVGGVLLVAACSGEYSGDNGSSGNADSLSAPGAADAPAVANEQAADSAAGGDENRPQVQDRKIVRTATLELQVENVVSAVQQIDDVATTAGGFVSSSNVFVDTEDEGSSELTRTQTASVTIRVPADAY